MEIKIAYKFQNDFKKICDKCDRIAIENNIQNNSNNLTNSSKYILYILHKEEIVAYISITEIGNNLNINQIAVLPYYKQRGIGSTLLRWTKEIFDPTNKKSYENIYAYVDSYNNVAIKFFEKNGYKLVPDMAIQNKCLLNYNILKFKK